jgi:hypothetical protein
MKLAGHVARMGKQCLQNFGREAGKEGHLKDLDVDIKMSLDGP